MNDAVPPGFSVKTLSLFKDPEHDKNDQNYFHHKTLVDTSPHNIWNFVPLTTHLGLSPDHFQQNLNMLQSVLYYYDYGW